MKVVAFERVGPTTAGLTVARESGTVTRGAPVPSRVSRERLAPTRKRHRGGALCFSIGTHQTRPRGRSDHNGAGDCKQLTPSVGRHSQGSEPEEKVIPCHRGGHRKRGCGHGSDDRGPAVSEGEFASNQGDRTADQANQSSSDDICTRVIGAEACGSARKERQGIYGEVKCGVPKNVAQSGSGPPTSETG